MAYKVKAFESRYFQLPSAFFALFQYLKSYGKQGRMLYFQRQYISEEMQSHKAFRVEVGTTPEHSGSNSSLQTAIASRKAYFPKLLDHEDSFNLSFAHPCPRRSSGEQTHQKPDICAACLLSKRQEKNLVCSDCDLQSGSAWSKKQCLCSQTIRPGVRRPELSSVLH